MFLLENTFMTFRLGGVECSNVCGGQDTGAVEAGHNLYNGALAWSLQTYYVCRAGTGSSAYVGFQVPLYKGGNCRINSGVAADKDCLCRTRGKHV